MKCPFRKGKISIPDDKWIKREETYFCDCYKDSCIAYKTVDRTDKVFGFNQNTGRIEEIVIGEPVIEERCLLINKEGIC